MVRDKVSMFPELRAVQIEMPGDVLEMREGSGEAPAHEAGVRLTIKPLTESFGGKPNVLLPSS